MPYRVKVVPEQLTRNVPRKAYRKSLINTG